MELTIADDHEFLFLPRFSYRVKQEVEKALGLRVSWQFAFDRS